MSRKVKRQIGNWVTLFILWNLMLPVSSVAAQIETPPTDLFVAVSAPPDAEPPNDPAVMRERYVTVQFSVLDQIIKEIESSGSADLRLPLFSDADLTARFTGIDAGVKGVNTLIGALPDVPYSEIYLSVQNEMLTLMVNSPDALYTVRALDGGLHRVREHNPDLTVEEWEPLDPPGISSSAVGALSSGSDDDGGRLDVLVVYTAKALQEYPDIENAASYALNEVNTGYSNSGITQRMRLAHTAQVSFDESIDSWGKILDYVTFKSGSSQDPNGVMDEVHTLRDTYHADLVVLLISKTGQCGLAWVMTSDWISTAFAPYAFSLVDADCIQPGYYTFGHEAGHNMGAAHDRANASGPAAYPYSYGYWMTSIKRYTVMAYSCGSGCWQINHFSNPEVFYQNVATGVDYQSPYAADVRRTFNNTATFVAKFRDGPAPAAPSGLSGSAGSASQINITWQDNSDDENRFEIERTLEGSGIWQIAGSAAANATQFSDSSLVCETNYQYRVRAFSSNGASLYSNTVLVATQNCAPLSPSNLTASALSTSRISLSWQDNSDDETGFYVQRLNGSVWQTLTTLPTNTIGYLNSGLSCSTQYAYRVIAYNDNGQSPPSNTASAETVICPPTAPAGLTGTALSQKRLQLDWQDSLRETGYRLEKSGDQTSWSLVADLASSSVAYLEYPLDCGTSAYYRVTAYNAGGSTPSDIVLSGPNICGPPSAPYGLTTTPVSYFSVKMAWQDILDDETSYRIERSLDGATGWQTAGVTPENETTFRDDALEQNTQYYFRVIAVNAYGDSLPGLVQQVNTYPYNVWIPMLP